MEKEKKSEIHITNNFNAPIGQHIHHVDTINFRMDGDGTFHFGMVENASCGGNNINGGAMDDEQRVKKCIDILWDEKVMIHLYDYTWVMECMNQTEGMPHFNTPISFIRYLEKLGISTLPSEDTINKKQNTFTGKFPDWQFIDCDTTESNRRINVGKRFLSCFRTA